MKVLLIGDQCEDIYQYGIVTRISPEAPVPVFMHQYQESRPGMAKNVAANLMAMGATVHSIFGANQSQKTRIIDTRSKQHLLRIDRDVASPVIDLGDLDLSDYKAVVISDYNKGSVSTKLINEIRLKFSGPIFLDTKKTELHPFTNIWIKINEQEHEKLTSKNNKLIVTLGDRGAQYQGELFPTKTVEVADVTGAGDTFLAALAYEFCRTASIVNAIQFANAAASITVQKNGVYAPSWKQIMVAMTL
jgi:bifunctional ADP-heptose synthase (sugar kinase/adenylyltransferase)